MSLLALQRDFRSHLLGDPGDVQAWLAPRAAGGLGVYHNAYRAQLIDCLAETYPHTHGWLGGAAFLAAMREHIEHHPPTSWTLGNYGAGFAGTLARLYRDDAEVVELAGLEWRLSRAFETGDADALPASAIGTIDWDKAILIFVPSLQIGPASTNAGAIWSALAAGDAPPAAVIFDRPAAMLVWRQAFTPCFRTIDMMEHDVVARAIAGLGFADICTMLVAARGEQAGLALAGQMLGQWFADGLILSTKDMTQR